MCVGVMDALTLLQQLQRPDLEDLDETGSEWWPLVARVATRWRVAAALTLSSVCCDFRCVC